MVNLHVPFKDVKAAYLLHVQIDKHTFSSAYIGMKMATAAAHANSINCTPHSPNPHSQLFCLEFFLARPGATALSG